MTFLPTNDTASKTPIDMQYRIARGRCKGILRELNREIQEVSKCEDPAVDDIALLDAAYADLKAASSKLQEVANLVNGIGK